MVKSIQKKASGSFILLKRKLQATMAPNVFILSHYFLSKEIVIDQDSKLIFRFWNYKCLQAMIRWVDCLPVCMWYLTHIGKEVKVFHCVIQMMVYIN